MVWLKRIGIGLLAIVLVAVAALYGGSQWVIGTKHEAPLIAFRAATAPAAIAEGKRIAAIAQCRDCHGDAGKGRVLEDSFLIGRLAPPGLARKAALYSDAELERLIRHGVKRDGTALWVMPAFTHLLHTGQGLGKRDLGAMREAVLGGMHELKDDEIAAIHAYLVTESTKAR